MLSKFVLLYIWEFGKGKGKRLLHQNNENVNLTSDKLGFHTVDVKVHSKLVRSDL